MILLDQLIESILPACELLAYCAFGKPKDCGMAPNLMVVWLEFYKMLGQLSFSGRIVVSAALSLGAKLDEQGILLVDRKGTADLYSPTAPSGAEGRVLRALASRNAILDLGEALGVSSASSMLE